MLHNQGAGAAGKIADPRRPPEDDGCSADDILANQRAGATGNVLLWPAEKALTHQCHDQEEHQLAGVSCAPLQTEKTFL